MPGTVLLLAASPVGRGRLVDAAAVLPVLAAVDPAVLAGTDTANVVELADPLDPQAVLTRLRAAASAPGPLTVYVTGQLQLDRRQRLPHLALARTTPATVRYTAFPWHWFREELRLRAPGATTLFLDLHGAMVAEHLEDGEGELLRRVRAVPEVGVAVGVVARVEDLHDLVEADQEDDLARGVRREARCGDGSGERHDDHQRQISPIGNEFC